MYYGSCCCQDPDMFVRVAERKPDGGVVLRGCKAHQQLGLLGADDGGSKPGDFMESHWISIGFCSFDGCDLETLNMWNLWNSLLVGGSSHLVNGLVHPNYKWINPTYPIYNWGYN